MLLPQMLAARDLPFPRLSAFAIWAYIIGGLVFFSTIFYDLAPKGGWFMYPPLTLKEYSPGDNADFWLLGIGFIEISAIAGAIEIIVGVLRTRPPGHDAGEDADLRLGHADLRRDDRLRFSGGDPGHHAAGDRTHLRLALLHRRRRAAMRCSGSICSGSSATPRSTSSSCRPQAWFR